MEDFRAYRNSVLIQDVCWQPQLSIAKVIEHICEVLGSRSRKYLRCSAMPSRTMYLPSASSFKLWRPGNIAASIVASFFTKEETLSFVVEKTLLPTFKWIWSDWVLLIVSTFPLYNSNRRSFSAVASSLTLNCISTVLRVSF